MVKIHIIEDNKEFAQSISDKLVDEGYVVSISESIKKARIACEESRFDLVILDIGLPDGDGFSYCKELREHYFSPILMLTAFDDDEDVVKGLQSGADDYVSKPCSLSVLTTRIQALLRRSKWNKEKTSILKSGDLSVDFVHQSVFCKDINLNLGKTEFDLVSALIQNHGQIMPRSVLLDRIWDEKERFIEDNTLSVHVSRLRNKLGLFEGNVYIETVKGIGYRWNVDIK